MLTNRRNTKNQNRKDNDKKGNLEKKPHGLEEYFQNEKSNYNQSGNEDIIIDYHDLFLRVCASCATLSKLLQRHPCRCSNFGYMLTHI